MIGALLFVLVLQSGLFWVFARWILAERNKAAGEEATRLVMLANYAVDSIKSKSIEEKVRSEALRKEYDLRLELYRDTVAKEVSVAKAKKKQEEVVPQWVHTDDGQRIDLNDVELL